MLPTLQQAVRKRKNQRQLFVSDALWRHYCCLFNFDPETEKVQFAVLMLFLIYRMIFNLIE